MGQCQCPLGHMRPDRGSHRFLSTFVTSKQLFVTSDWSALPVVTSVNSYSCSLRCFPKRRGTDIAVQLTLPLLQPASGLLEACMALNSNSSQSSACVRQVGGCKSLIWHRNVVLPGHVPRAFVRRYKQANICYTSKLPP